MASIKKKINELTPKETPVLADSIVISDSENSGRGALVEVTDLQTLIGGGGGGAVDSVAGKTGVVTLDASDIAETDALKIMTADERTKLTGIAEGAEVNTVDSVAGKTGVVTLDADDVATTASKLWMSDTQSAKLAGIAENANNYTHPETHPQSMIEGLGDALAAKAPLASPALTGTPTAPTAASGTDTTQIATTEFVQDALADISIDADPYSVKLTGDQSISGIKTFTSSPVLPTPTAGDNTTKAATTAFVTGAVAGVSGGAVDSVAGKTGVVTLDADDVDPTSTKLWFTDTQASKLAGIAENANNYTHPASHPQSMIEGLATDLAAKAPLASPALTGTPTAPTAASGTDTTQIATTEFVQDALADISIDADPYSVKLTGDQSISGIKTFTSSPVLPTPTAGDNTTKAATTAFVTGAVAGVSGGAVDSVAGKTGVVTLDADDVDPTSTKLWFTDTQASKLAGIAENANNYTHPASHPQSMIEGLATDLAAKAPLASPALTGTPTAPTAASGTDTTQIATTEFVQDALADISIDADPYSVKLTGDQSISGIKTFTTSPVLPTPTAGDNTTKGATTAFVTGAVAACRPKHQYIYSSKSSTSIAAERGNTYGINGDSCTLTLPLATTAGYVDGDEICVVLGVSDVRTLTITSPSQVMRVNGLNPANTPFDVTGVGTVISFTKYSTAWAMSYPEYALAGKAPLASPALTGNPTAPTAALGTNTTQLATTAFVQAALAGALMLKGTPRGPTATGTKGMARFDADYLYVCTETNTWVRFPKDGSWI